MFCGVDEKGKLGNFVCDWLGNKKTEFNGVDFLNGNWLIPNFEKVQNFAVHVAEYVLHHDLVALDIVLDKSNEPRLLEINVGGFGGWAFQFTSGSMFGDYANEIMAYCSEKGKSISLGLVERLY